MIVGVGAIGKRHFQSLIKLKGKANFILIDPIFKNLTIKQRNKILGIKYNKLDKKIYFYYDIKNWLKKSTDLDLCIISTSSVDRFLIFKEIISSVTIKYIILEKFLFNKIIDYNKALKLSKIYPTQVFVNQWITQSSKIRNILDNFKNDQLEIKVSGIEWGMACNIVHFIDMGRYFGVEGNITPIIKHNKLNSKIRPARRDGYYEVYGNISLKYGKHYLHVSCQSGDVEAGCTPKGIDIEIKSKKFKNKYAMFNLKSDQIKGLLNNKGKINYFSEKIELMSKLTGIVFDSLYSNKKIYLPTLNQSIKQHIVIFKVFSDHFKKKLKIKNGTCPVT